MDCLCGGARLAQVHTAVARNARLQLVAMAMTLPFLALQVLPPSAYVHQPASSFNTRFVHAMVNKVILSSCAFRYMALPSS